MVMSASTKAPETEERSSSVSSGGLRKRDLICVVMVIDATLSTALQVIKNPQEAIDTARHAEELEYEFYGDEPGIYVYYLEMGKRYGKREFGFTGGNIPVDYPVIFHRYKMNGEWKEEWYNETMKFILGLR